MSFEVAFVYSLKNAYMGSIWWLWTCFTQGNIVNTLLHYDVVRNVFVSFAVEGDLLKLLDVSSVENVLLTTYGKLQPPLGKHRLKVFLFFFFFTF